MSRNKFSSAPEESNLVYTTGSTITELFDNALEATNLYLEDQNILVTHENLNFKQFFQYYNVINAKTLANKIGMNPTLLSQYIQGHKKPSESQTKKILSGIQQIGKERNKFDL